MPLTLMYITNNPAVALIAEKNGVDRVFLDLEYKGKDERQKNMNTVKNKHTVFDVKTISAILTNAELMARINPWDDDSPEEIEAVIEAGADRIMLPMWKTPLEADSFLKTVNNRVRTTLLLETKEAVECIDEVLDNPLIDEIHIGLNDLHLSYGLTFMFELLSNGTVETLCNKMRAKGIPFGFGGIARPGEGVIPAEKIITEHNRLGSTRAILSRSFCNCDEVKDLTSIENIFSVNMALLRDFERSLDKLSENQYFENRDQLHAAIKHFVDSKKGSNNVN